MIQLEILRDFMRFLLHTEKFPKLYTDISVQNAIDYCSESYVTKTSQQSINLFNTCEDHNINNYFENYDLTEQDFEHLKKLTLEKSMTKFLPHFDSFNQHLNSHNVTDYIDDFDEGKQLNGKTQKKDKRDGFLGDEEEEREDGYDSVDNANDPKKLLQRGRLYLNNRIPFGKFDGYGSIRPHKNKTSPKDRQHKKKKVERKISENNDSDKEKSEASDTNEKNKNSTNNKNKNDDETSDDSFDDIVSSNLIYLPANQAQEQSNDKDLKIDHLSENKKKSLLAKEKKKIFENNKKNINENNKNDTNSNNSNNNINNNNNFDNKTLKNENFTNNVNNNNVNNNNNSNNNNDDDLHLDAGSMKMFRRRESIEEEKFQSLQYTDDGKQLSDQSTDPPRFSVTPQDKRCRQNSDVMIVCSVVGARPYGVTWYKHSKELIELDASDDRYTFASNSVQNSIRIKNVAYEDKGYYMCMAYNKYGFCQKGFRIKVDEGDEEDEDEDDGLGVNLVKDATVKTTTEPTYVTLADEFTSGYNRIIDIDSNSLTKRYTKEGKLSNENVQEYVVDAKNVPDRINEGYEPYNSTINKINTNESNNSIGNNNNNNNRINNNDNNNNNNEEIQETRFSGSDGSDNDYMKVIDNRLNSYRRFTSDIAHNTTPISKITDENKPSTPTITTMKDKEPKATTYGSKKINVETSGYYNDIKRKKKTDIDTYMQRNISLDKKIDYRLNSQISEKKDKLASQILSKTHIDGVVVDNSFDTYEEIKINKRDWKEENVHRYFEPVDLRDFRRTPTSGRPSSMLSHTFSIDSLRSIKKRNLRAINSYNYETNVHNAVSDESSSFADKSDIEKKLFNSDFYSSLDLNSRSSYDNMSVASTDTITNTYESSRDEDSYSVNNRNIEDDDRIIDFYSKSIKDYAYDNYSINSNLIEGYDTNTRNNDYNNNFINGTNINKNEYNNNIKNNEKKIENNKNNRMSNTSNVHIPNNVKPVYNTNILRVNENTSLDSSSGVPMGRKSLEKNFEKSFQSCTSKFSDYLSYNGANYNEYLRDTGEYLKSAKKPESEREIIYSDVSNISNYSSQNNSSIYDEAMSDKNNETNNSTSNYNNANRDFYTKKDINNNVIETKPTNNLQKAHSTCHPSQAHTSVQKVSRHNRGVEYSSMPSVSDLRRKFDDFSTEKTDTKTAKIPRYKYF